MHGIEIVENFIQTSIDANIRVAKEFVREIQESSKKNRRNHFILPVRDNIETTYCAKTTEFTYVL